MSDNLYLSKAIYNKKNPTNGEGGGKYPIPPKMILADISVSLSSFAIFPFEKQQSRELSAILQRVVTSLTEQNNFRDSCQPLSVYRDT